MAQQIAPDVTIATIDKFNDAFNSHDVDAIMALMTPDCVFESTCPPPDGVRYEGQSAVRQVWEDLFQSSPDVHFAMEDVIAAGDRCTTRWLMRYTGEDGVPRHLRGVDVFRVRAGQVAEKFSYVKG